jgi:hypothetical protein
MQCVQKLGNLKQVMMGGGLIWTKSKCAIDEFGAMDTVMVRGRKIMGRLIDVAKKVADVWHDDKAFDPIADGGLVDPKEVSWHKVRGSMNDNAAAGTAALITTAVKEAAVEYHGKEKWESMSTAEQAEASESYEFTCWNHNRALICEHGLTGMKKWLSGKLEQSLSLIKASPCTAWVRSDVCDLEGSARAVWKQFASVQYGTTAVHYYYHHCHALLLLLL